MREILRESHDPNSERNQAAKDILVYKKNVKKLIEQTEDGLKLFMMIELGYKGFNTLPKRIQDDITDFIGRVIYK